METICERLLKNKLDLNLNDDTLCHIPAPAILSAINIKIENVCDYFNKYFNNKKFIEIKIDFPNLMPPFKSFWMEHAPFKNEPGWDRYGRFGFLFERSPEGTYIEFNTHPPLPGESHLTVSSMESKKFEDVGCVQLLAFAYVYMKRKEFETIKVIGIASFICDRNGNARKSKWVSFDEKYYHFYSQIFPCLLAINFMHCKNVVIKKNIYPDHEIREYQKRYGKPPVKYYTIDIEPAKTILKNEGGIHQVGLQKALHLCRGHFKHFEEGGGLFGKYHGTYWWPQIMRGNKEFGEVKKDYNVKALVVEN